MKKELITVRGEVLRRENNLKQIDLSAESCFKSSYIIVDSTTNAIIDIQFDIEDSNKSWERTVKTN